jgi:hypothetical protein
LKQIDQVTLRWRIDELTIMFLQNDEFPSIPHLLCIGTLQK